MSEYGEVEHDEVRAVAPAGGFGRHGGGVQRHITLKFEDTVSCTGGVEQHVVKEKFKEVDTVACTGGVVERHVVKETFEEEVDTLRGTGGHHHHHHGHYGHGVHTGGHHHHHLGHYGHGVDTSSSSHHHHHHDHYGHGVHTGGHHHNHGHYDGHGVVVRETRVEEDFDPCTGEFHKRKETFLRQD